MSIYFLFYIFSSHLASAAPSQTHRSFKPDAPVKHQLLQPTSNYEKFNKKDHNPINIYKNQQKFTRTGENFVDGSSDYVKDKYQTNFHSYDTKSDGVSTPQFSQSEDRIDLVPLVNLLQQFEDDPTGVVASLIASTWDFLPQYSNVEIRKNLNKLKSGFDANHFMIRDTVVWIGGSLMWLIFHLLFWDGRVNNYEDLDASIRSPGVKVELPSHSDLANGVTQPDNSNDSKGNTFLTEPDINRYWQGLTNPSSSIRSIFTTLLYGLASQILWILPTFIGKVPVPDSRIDSLIKNNLDFENLKNLTDPADDRILTLIENLSTAPLPKNWNRLMSLQGVFNNIGINFLNYFGRWLFWSFATKNLV